MAIKIFNTISKKEENLVTIAPNQLKMYVCGPTVYDRPHLGNARSALVYDMFYRFFCEMFEKVIYVRNITDVDDKINAAALARKISIGARACFFFHVDIQIGQAFGQGAKVAYPRAIIVKADRDHFKLLQVRLG